MQISPQRLQSPKHALVLSGREGAESRCNPKSARMGETLNTRLLAFTGEDLVWLNSFRNKLSTLFAEGAASYGSGTTICDRFIRFRERLGGLSISLMPTPPRSGLTVSRSMAQRITFRRYGQWLKKSQQLGLGYVNGVPGKRSGTRQLA